MSKSPRMSQTTLLVLKAFLEVSGAPMSGAEIHKKTGISSGSLYPAFARLVKAGWLESDGENVSSHEASKPRRQYYQLTNVGRQKIRESLSLLAYSPKAPSQLSSFMHTTGLPKCRLESLARM